MTSQENTPSTFLQESGQNLGHTWGTNRGDSLVAN
jgi:hypothetical protein